MTTNPEPCNRQFHWMSSVTGDLAVLSDLNQRMAWFYGQADGRASYQEMLNEQEEYNPAEESVRHLMPKFICEQKPQRILEIGCGNGRLYRQLRDYGYTGHYSAVEMAEYLIEENRRRHPEADWNHGPVYRLPFADDSFDLCFSLYVLEHLVYPETALREMLRVLKPHGRLVLVFPDFVEAGLLPSQKLGLSLLESASQKLRRGKILDALISLYDSRVRLRRALKDAVGQCGPFPVNTRPLCLTFPNIMGPDIDAIYIASKQEVQDWAQKQGFDVTYPRGIEGEFADQSFMVITRQ